MLTNRVSNLKLNEAHRLNFNVARPQLLTIANHTGTNCGTKARPQTT